MKFFVNIIASSLKNMLKVIGILAIFLIGWRGIYIFGRLNVLFLFICAAAIGGLVYLTSGLEEGIYLFSIFAAFFSVTKLSVFIFDSFSHLVEMDIEDINLSDNVEDAESWLFALFGLGISFLSILIWIILFWYGLDESIAKFFTIDSQFITNMLLGISLLMPLLGLFGLLFSGMKKFNSN